MGDAIDFNFADDAYSLRKDDIDGPWSDLIQYCHNGMSREEIVRLAKSLDLAEDMKEYAKDMRASVVNTLKDIENDD
jgi:hypothetical protein